MRASRAYIAGFGTTGVLVGSALLLLVVVSTLVAFQGGPGNDFADDIGSLVVDEPERLPVEGPVQVALNASTAAAAVAQAPAPGSAAATRAPVAPRAGTADPPVTVPTTIFAGDPDRGRNFNNRGGDGGGGGPVDTGPAPDPGGLLPENPLSPQVNRVTDGLGDTTQGLTDGLGYTVGRLNPQLGQTLTDTGRGLSDLIRSLGEPRR